MVFVFGVTLGACAGGGGGSTPPSAADDKARAGEVVLRQADLPRLREEPRVEDDETEPSPGEEDAEDDALEDRFLSCLGDNALLDNLGKGPRGESSEFNDDEGSVSVLSLVVFAEQEDEAEAAFAEMSRQGVAECLEETLRTTFEQFGSAPEISVSTLPVDTRSDGQIGYRITLVPDLPPELDALPDTASFDLVFLRGGRGLAGLFLTDRAGTFDEGERARLTDLLSKRLREAS